MNLEQFTGSENHYRHFFGGVYTDGVKYVADEARAYWLLNAIFSYRHEEPFQIWELKVTKEHTATLTMCEDSGLPEKVRQDFDVTDFPEPGIKFYLIDGILLLPSEY